jgi:hypothetical protein
MSRLALAELVRENLAFMRLAITLLALSIVTGSVLYFGGLAFLNYAEDKAAVAGQRYAAAREQLARAETEKEEIRLYLAPYQALAAAGKAGEEKRLEWIDALTRIREQHKLFPIDYDIASRRPYTLHAGPPAPALSLSASRMHLQFGLLHEGDLLTLLNKLRTESKGYFVLDRCTLDRTAMDPIPQQTENLTGECTLDWISFQPTTSEPPEP